MNSPKREKDSMGIGPVPREVTLQIWTRLKGGMCTSWVRAGDWSRGRVPLVRWTGQWLDLVKVSAANAEVG